MSREDSVLAHQLLELELYRLRLLRDLGNPEYRAVDEDAVLDEMESVWNRLTAEDRKLLEAARGARCHPVSIGQLPAVDVPVDAWLRCGMPPRVTT